MDALIRFIVTLFQNLFGGSSGSVDPVTPAPPVPPRVPPATPDTSPSAFRIGHQIVKWEGRTDGSGNLKLYALPSGDGGGSHEIAGLNTRYHPEILKKLIAAPPEDRRQMAAEYIENHTRKGTGMDKMEDLRSGTQLAVLDTAFNRGASGCARTIQMALKTLGRSVIVDGQWGPKTRRELLKADQFNAQAILPAIRKAREKYERRKRDESSKFWKGLENRWEKQLKASTEWNAQNDQRNVSPPPVPSDPVQSTESLPWYRLALKEIGVKEIKGSKHNPKILDYWKDADLDFSTDETPWCAGFVGAMIERAGIKSTGSGMARSYMKWGKSIKSPTVGCVVVFWRGSRSGSSGHVGFYAGKDRDGNIMVLGGNQSDAVNIKPFSTSRVLGYRWPEGVDLPRDYPFQPVVRSDGRVSTRES